MKLRRLRRLGRYQQIGTNRRVNIWTGDRVGRGTTVYFYLYRQQRQLITDNELYGSTKKWEKVQD